jgi:probable F420-dependent oxidoreductase
MDDWIWSLERRLRCRRAWPDVLQRDHRGWGSLQPALTVTPPNHHDTLRQEWQTPESRTGETTRRECNVSLTFGCALSQTIFGPLAGPMAIRTLAQRAEALGFHSIWFADHIVIPRHVKPAYPYETDGMSPFDPAQPFYEPLSVLNYLAGCTERIRLGMHVLIVPYREPIFTAKILATLDALSGGRLTLGAGTGWMLEEFEALGVTTFAERGAVTNEYLLLFKELWTKENPKFNGKYVQASDIGFLPKPAQRPHPPIWIGGHSLAALRRVALLGDGWMPIALRPPSLLRPPEMGEKIGRLRGLLRDAGRAEDAVTISVTAPVVVTRTPASPRPLLQGTPEQIAVDLREYQALGVENFSVNLPGADISQQSEAMDQFKSEIVPLLD